MSAVSIFDALPEVEKRKWEAERRIIRNGIQKARSIPLRERTALMFFTNLWFYHRNVDGFIRPGAKRLAQKLECSERTARSVLKYHREAGYLIELKYGKGGRNATRYAVNLALILDNLCTEPGYAPSLHDDIRRQNIAHINRAKSRLNPAKSADGIYKAHPLKSVSESFDDPSDWTEVPF